MNITKIIQMILLEELKDSKMIDEVEESELKQLIDECSSLETRLKKANDKIVELAEKYKLRGPLNEQS